MISSTSAARSPYAATSPTATVRNMRRPTAGGTGITAITAAMLVLAACTLTPAPDPTASPTSTPTASTSVTPTPTPSATPTVDPTPRAPLPGESCDPADGSPDCTDATADSQFRYIEGYADCVSTFTTDERYGLCTDLDGDGRAGYPDSG